MAWIIGTPNPRAHRRTRQLEVRPNLQLFLLLPEVALELKVGEEMVCWDGKRDPFINLRASGLGVTVSSYEGGDISVLLGMHSLRVDGYERAHPAAALEERNMVGGFGYSYSNKLRGKFGSGSGRVARLPGRKKSVTEKNSPIREKVYFCARKRVNFSLALFLFYLMEK